MSYWKRLIRESYFLVFLRAQVEITHSSRRTSKYVLDQLNSILGRTMLCQFDQWCFFCQGPKIQSKILCLRDSLGVSLGDHDQTICLKNTFFETTIEKLFSSWDGFETPTVEKSLYRRFSGVPSFSKLFLYYLRNWVSFLTWARWNTREIVYTLQLMWKMESTLDWFLLSLSWDIASAGYPVLVVVSFTSRKTPPRTAGDIMTTVLGTHATHTMIKIILTKRYKLNQRFDHSNWVSEIRGTFSNWYKILT